MPTRFPIATAQQLTAYVRALRKSRRYTQADVARMLGVSAVRVAAIEKDVGRLSTSSLIALLQLLGARLDLDTDAEITSHSLTSVTATTQVNERVTSPSTAYRRSRGGEW